MSESARAFTMKLPTVALADYRSSGGLALSRFTVCRPHSVSEVWLIGVLTAFHIRALPLSYRPCVYPYFASSGDGVGGLGVSVNQRSRPYRLGTRPLAQSPSVVMVEATPSSSDVLATVSWS